MSTAPAPPPQTPAVPAEPSPTPNARRRRGKLFKRRFTKPGALPGRFAGTARPDSSRLRVLSYHKGRWKDQDDVPINRLPARNSADLLWFDLRGVQDHAAVRAIGAHLELHPLAIADVVNVGQRPKLEEYEDDELFIVIRATVREDPPPPAPGVEAVEQDEAEVIWRWEQFALFIGEGFVATFQEYEGDCLDHVRRRLSHAAYVQPPVTTAWGLSAAILDAIVDNYFPLLEHLSDRLERIEDAVVERPERAVLAEIYQVKRDMLAFRRAAWPLRDVLSELGRLNHRLLPDAVKPFLRDTADHAVQVVDVLESYRELAASFIDVYLSSISYQTNEVMRVLTIIATIFIPLTFLAGVYGMNFDVLPELHWAWGYGVFWAICVGLAAVMLGMFWRLGWIGRKKR